MMSQPTGLPTLGRITRPQREHKARMIKRAHYEATIKTLREQGISISDEELEAGFVEWLHKGAL